MYSLDYHIHTPLCKHAVGSPEQYLRRAKTLGLDEIGVADHCPWPKGYDTGSRMAPKQYIDYKRIVAGMRKKSNGIAVKYGLEVDWVPGRMDQVAKRLKSEPFDFILGSIHYVGDFAFDNSEFIDEWEKPEVVERVWSEYPKLLLDFVRDYDFDIIAHADLPKKFAYYPVDYPAFLKAMDEVFNVAADKGMAIEINSGGLRKPCNEMYPKFDLLKRAAKRGLALTFGSDAHAPDEVGANLLDARSMAAEAGFTQLVSFTRRQRTLYDL